MGQVQYLSFLKLRDQRALGALCCNRSLGKMPTVSDSNQLRKISKSKSYPEDGSFKNQIVSTLSSSLKV